MQIYHHTERERRKSIASGHPGSACPVKAWPDMVVTLQLCGFWTIRGPEKSVISSNRLRNRHSTQPKANSLLVRGQAEPIRPRTKGSALADEGLQEGDMATN
jgi:hypothetical protein